MSSKYLYGVLLVLVALSKEFLVFNEEVLVLLAFAIFIYLLVNYGGEMIAGELDSRKEKIKEEFDLYKNLQEKTFTHLISYHQKQKLLSSEIKEVFEIRNQKLLILKNIMRIHYKIYLYLNFEERLKRVSTNENKTNSRSSKRDFS